MNENLHVDDYGRELIAKFEGKQNRAYKDSVGIPTIGIGFIRYTLGDKAGQKVQMGDLISDEEIAAEFANQIQRFEKAVRDAVQVELTQSQFNACVSLCSTSARRHLHGLRLSANSTNAGIRLPAANLRNGTRQAGTW